MLKNAPHFQEKNNVYTLRCEFTQKGNNSQFFVQK